VPEVRERALAGMEWAGIELDATANRAARGVEAAIHSARSRVRVQVVPVDEESVMVRGAEAALTQVITQPGGAGGLAGTTLATMKGTGGGAT
jgi:acetate kinase